MQPLLIVLIAALIPLVFGIVIALFRWLWNITMPQVFGLKTITFWQAFRLLLLAGMLSNGGAFLKINLSP